MRRKETDRQRAHQSPSAAPLHLEIPGRHRGLEQGRHHQKSDVGDGVATAPGAREHPAVSRPGKAQVSVDIVVVF